LGQGGREKVLQALGKLSAGGSTNGGAGIELAYRLARENFVESGINRVILATDGDFNVGTTSHEELVELVKKEAESGTFLSVCGFGRGNLNDAMLEAITNEGNGVYYYIDSREEGRRVFLEKLMGTLVTIAKDVKLQMEFNPAKVSHYRLIGYANRLLRKEDFNDDDVDAGDIGSGHQVTAFYEIVPDGVEGTIRPKVDDLKYQAEQEQPQSPRIDSPDWLTVKLRHKKLEGGMSELQEFVLRGDAEPWEEMDADYRFAAGVALWGMTMRDFPSAKGLFELVQEMIENSAGQFSQRNEFLNLIQEQESE
jgi:Ca-activated chloride channel family protein